MIPDDLPVPVETRPPMAWGSDALAALLGTLDLPYIAMVPGSSYRGLHDSIVNFLGNRAPQILICLHEEHSVAIAQGYAKVTGRPMLVALHANVGLMHAAMAIYNAYCDRTPMVVLGATGPVDAAKRRPWIDWVHTAADQGALVRDYVKWDDQPASVAAALESIVRGNVLTRATPNAPVYICLDSELQEDPLPEGVQVPDPTRYPVPLAPAPDAATVAHLRSLVAQAERPLLLLGRSDRDEARWAARVALAERLGLAVLTDMRMPAAFPTEHGHHPATPGAGRLTESGHQLVERADLIIALEWTELGGTLASVFGDGPRPAVVSCRTSDVFAGGWTKDHYATVPADLEITAAADQVVQALLPDADADVIRRQAWPPVLEVTAVVDRTQVSGDPILMPDLAEALRKAAGSTPVAYTTLPLGWWNDDAQFSHPLDYLGRDGGGGVGSGPGIAVGAALALDGTGRIPVAVIGDGDFLMGSSALWTAAHYQLPLLVVIANNRSYHNDEGHQERVAERRSRPTENRTVGQLLRDPDPDPATIAQGYGLTGIGPVSEPDELLPTLTEAMARVQRGETVVVDVRVNPLGYGRL